MESITVEGPTTEGPTITPKVSRSRKKSAAKASVQQEKAPVVLSQPVSTPPTNSKSIQSSFTKRNWLFKKSRPLIRQYDHQKDIGFLWSAYLRKSFALEDGLEGDAFVSVIAGVFSRFNYILVI